MYKFATTDVKCLRGQHANRPTLWRKKTRSPAERSRCFTLEVKDCCERLSRGSLMPVTFSIYLHSESRAVCAAPRFPTITVTSSEPLSSFADQSLTCLWFYPFFIISRFIISRAVVFYRAYFRHIFFANYSILMPKGIGHNSWPTCIAKVSWCKYSNYSRV